MEPGGVHFKHLSRFISFDNYVVIKINCKLLVLISLHLREFVKELHKYVIDLLRFSSRF